MVKPAASVTSGKLVSRIIVPLTLKVIVSAPAWVFAVVIASRSEPAPLSDRLATTRGPTADVARGPEASSKVSAISAARGISVEREV